MINKAMEGDRDAIDWLEEGDPDEPDAYGWDDEDEDAPAMPTRPDFIDLTGRTFGRLKVVAYAGKRGKSHMWRCLCGCDGETIRIVYGGDLRSGHTQGCGCISRERGREANTKHGCAGQGASPEINTLYDRHQAMVGRCLNENHREFPRYGGRGITVVDRWLGPDGFEMFFWDMGFPPTPKHSIDRIDNDGPYAPSNCRWATPREQNRNMRTNVWVRVPGESEPVILTDACALYGFTTGAVYGHMRRHNLGPQAAFDHVLAIRGIAPAKATHTPVSARIEITFDQEFLDAIARLTAAITAEINAAANRLGAP